MKPCIVICVAALALLVAACNSGLKSSRGFRLPDGDADKGRTAFVDLKCFACHQVEGVELPAAIASQDRVIKLGGPVSRVRTYGDLTASIIHPSYSLSEAFAEKPPADKISPMPEFNEVMTVAQLVHLVSFLQPHYTLLEPVYSYH